jgi:hypothetical protein
MGASPNLACFGSQERICVPKLVRNRKNVNSTKVLSGTGAEPNDFRDVIRGAENPTLLPVETMKAPKADPSLTIRKLKTFAAPFAQNDTSSWEKSQ